MGGVITGGVIMGGVIMGGVITGGVITGGGGAGGDSFTDASVPVPPPPPPPPPPPGGGARKEPIKISSANRKLAQKKQNMMANLMKAVANRRKKIN
jgi:hypothetical protein